MSADLYKEIILDYYRNPRNYGRLENPTFRAEDSNPLCGDVIEIQVKLGSDNKVSDIKFNGKGCAISQASASMLTELVMHKHIDEIKKLERKDTLKGLGLETLELNPVRIKCALLPIKVLKLGLYNHLGEELRTDETAEDSVMR